MARLRRVATGRVVPPTTSVFVVFSVVLFNLGPVPAVVEVAGSPRLDNTFAWGPEKTPEASCPRSGTRARGSTGSLAHDAVYAVNLATAGA